MAGTQAIAVMLTGEFPYELPHVFLADPAKAPHALPHVDKIGKICIAPDGGALLDIGRPRDLVRETVAKARAVITDGLANPLPELQREFLAYWDSGYKPFLWVTDAPEKEGEVTLLHIYDKDSSKLYEHVVSRSVDEGKAWVARAGKFVKSTDKAYFIPLAKPLLPPRFGERWTVKGFFEILEVAGVDVDGAMQWLADVRPPTDIFLSMPGPSGSIVVGVRLEATHGKRAASKYFSEYPDSTATRLDVRRLDSGFLLPRAGGTTSFLGKTVVVVGCGAIGSQAANLLALLGVGNMHVIDPQILESGNTQRHLLGVDMVGAQKASAVVARLTLAYPHLKFTAHDKTALEAFSGSPDLFAKADAILFATGDETLERRMNDILTDGPRRVHAWIEPLGLGGHAIAIEPGKPGCLNCLYEKDLDTGLSNAAAFVAPGQKLRKSFSGCAGDFLPYSALDAVRIAQEATRLLGQSLAGELIECTLVSWHGEKTIALREQVRLTHKVSQFASGETKRGPVHKLDCLSCSGA